MKGNNFIYHKCQCGNTDKIELKGYFSLYEVLEYIKRLKKEVNRIIFQETGIHTMDLDFSTDKELKNLSDHINKSINDKLNYDIDNIEYRSS